VNETNPDVVFIDYRLSGITGDQVANMLPVAIPKYLITGEINLASKYEFEGVFSKPMDQVGIGLILENLKKIKTE
jgi:hypothetical protein